jgi:hypothetical protein
MYLFKSSPLIIIKLVFQCVTSSADKGSQSGPQLSEDSTGESIVFQIQLNNTIYILMIRDPVIHIMVIRNGLRGFAIIVIIIIIFII